MPAYLIEACVGTLAAAQHAAQAGAHQLELCARLDLGGTTPHLDLVRAVVAATNLPVKVMVRPRGGHFVYTESEVVAMEQSLYQLHACGIAGVVFGALTPQHQIDTAVLERLLRAAPAGSVTFHKAIDQTRNPLAALAILRQLNGVSHILTSGGAATARAGLSVLQQMQAATIGEPITIIAAGNITRENLPALHQQLGGALYHGRQIV